MHAYQDKLIYKNLSAEYIGIERIPAKLLILIYFDHFDIARHLSEPCKISHPQLRVG